MGGLQRGRDEDAVDAIDSDGASPEAPDRLSVLPVPAVDPTERVQLRRRPREVVPGLQPGPRTVRLAARAVTLHSLFLVRHGSVPDAVSLYGRGARPITGVSIYAPVSTVPSPARAEALCALSPKPVFRSACVCPVVRKIWGLSSPIHFSHRISCVLFTMRFQLSPPKNGASPKNLPPKFFAGHLPIRNPRA